MGTKTVRFKCHRSLHCCIDVIALPTPWDAICIIKATGLKPLEFLEFITPDQISEVEEDDPTWLRCNGQRYVMALQRKPEYGCCFLDRDARGCAIYEDRPILCRLFPFKLQETRDGQFRGFTVHKDVCCPVNQNGVFDTAPLHALYLEDTKHHDDYATMVKVFNRRAEPNTRPEDFIRMFYMDEAEMER